MRLQAHRALRLFVTAGTWAAGLCLVTGALVLVAAAAAKGRSGHLATEAAAPAAAGADYHRRIPRLDSGRRVVATFAGRGSETTARFRTDARASWQLRWSYRCGAGATNGLLVVAPAAAATGPAVDTTGPAGHGSTGVGPVAGRSHRLVVISTCRWRIEVTQRR